MGPLRIAPDPKRLPSLCLSPTPSSPPLTATPSFSFLRSLMLPIEIALHCCCHQKISVVEVFLHSAHTTVNNPFIKFSHQDPDLTSPLAVLTANVTAQPGTPGLPRTLLLLSAVFAKTPCDQTRCARGHDDSSALIVLTALGYLTLSL